MKTTSKFTNSKNKIVGETKKKFGKITGNKKLEFQGKVQSTTADIKKKIDSADISKKIDNVKEDLKDVKKDFIKKAQEIKDKSK